MASGVQDMRFGRLVRVVPAALLSLAALAVWGSRQGSAQDQAPAPPISGLPIASFGNSPGLPAHVPSAPVAPIPLSPPATLVPAIPADSDRVLPINLPTA